MNFMEQAHVARLAAFAQHGQPRDYGGSDMMRADLEALIRSALQHQEEPRTAVIPPAPPECETEDEKTAFAFGYWQGLHAARKGQEVPREPVGERISDERILRLWDTHVGDPSAKYPLSDFDKLEFARAVLRAAVLAPSTTRQQEVGIAPEGFRLLPVEATDAMMYADWDVTMSDAHSNGGVSAAAWRAMVEAAPQVTYGNGHSGVGWYMHDTDYPEEGAVFLGAAAPSTPENAGGVQASGEAEPTIREQTLAGLVKRLAWLAPKDHAARIAATECLQRYGYLSPLRADVSGVGEFVSQTPPPLGTDGGTPQ